MHEYSFSSSIKFKLYTRPLAYTLFVPLLQKIRLAMDVTNKLKSQAKAEYVKMSSLNINREYCIKWLRSHESSYGRTIVATVDGNLQVYLPKSINLTEKEIEEFNKGNEKLSLVYHGKNGNAYNFSFI